MGLTTQQLTITMHLLLEHTLAPSTTHQYRHAFQHYQAFCSHRNLTIFPISEFNLMLFTTYLATFSSYHNIKLHIAAIKHFATLSHTQIVHPPLPRLYLLIRAIKRKHGKHYTKPKRVPVTSTSLQIIYNYLQNSMLPTHDKFMLWAASTTAFFAFLRSSEFVSNTTKSYNTDTTLLISDITVTHQGATLKIKSSKTDPFRQGCHIKLCNINSLICPVQALKQYLAIHPFTVGPLFTYADKSFLTRRRLNTFLRSAIPSSKNAPVSSHSFRIGAATTATAGGIPRWTIQKLGRWNSDCYRTYIQLSDATILDAQTTIATTTRTGTAWNPDDH